MITSTTSSASSLIQLFYHIYPRLLLSSPGFIDFWVDLMSAGTSFGHGQEDFHGSLQGFGAQVVIHVRHIQ